MDTVPDKGINQNTFWAKHLLKHEAKLSNEAGEGKGAEGIDAVHVLQDALLLFLTPIPKRSWLEVATQKMNPYPSWK